MQPAAPVSRESSFIHAIILFLFFILDALNSVAEPGELGTRKYRCMSWTPGWSSSSQQQHAAQMELNSEKCSTFRKQNETLSNSSKRDLSGEVSEKAVDAWNGKQLRKRLVPPPSQPLRKPRRTRARPEAADRSLSGDSKGFKTPSQANSVAGSDGRQKRKRPNLNCPTMCGKKPTARSEVLILAKGRRVGAAQVPAHTQREPALASSQCGNGTKECKRVSRRKSNQDKRPR